MAPPLIRLRGGQPPKEVQELLALRRVVQRALLEPGRIVAGGEESGEQGEEEDLGREQDDGLGGGPREEALG